MALLPRHGRRRTLRRGDVRLSLCLTRRLRADTHPVRRPSPRYGTWLTGATLVASILAALAVWPRDVVAFPGLTNPRDVGQRVSTQYSFDDFAARMH